MSFYCGACHELAPKGQKATKLPLETREVVYPRRADANRRTIDGRYPDDPGGTGWEIVQEINICDSCVEALGNGTAEIVEVT